MRTPLDQFGKQMVGTALAPGGPVQTDAEVVPTDARRIDVWFMPDPVRGAPRTDLGLLGRIADGHRTFELFHRTPDGDGLAACVIKHGNFRHALSLRDPPPLVPVQYVISSGRPDGGIEGLCFRPAPGGPAGIYDGPALLWTRLVVVSELSVERDTLLLRLLGSGRVLKQAIAELKALPHDAPERTLALPILVQLRVEVPRDPTKQTSEDQEFMMNTEEILDSWRREGAERALSSALIDFYEARFGAIPPEVRTAIENTHDEPTLRGWVKLFAKRSANEIAAAVHASHAS